MEDETFDEAGFEAWLSGDPRRRPVFDTMWRRIMGSDTDAALMAWGRRGASRRALVTSSVAILLAVAGGYRAMPLVELHLAEPRHYDVAEGAVREVTLADGSRLILAAGANVQVRYTRHHRVIGLTHGTIFADVARDEKRPFRVNAGDARIVNIGTSFEVLHKPGNVRVTVASGAVSFGDKGWFDQPITLKAKQGATLDASGLNRTTDVNASHVARWRSEWVEYQGAPLRQVVADLQSLSPLPITITSESLASQPVSGRMRLTDPTGQLQNLAIIHAFHIRYTDEALILSKE